MRYDRVSILGTGSYLPNKKITNQNIESRIDTTHEWISSKLGINERRIVEDELPSDMGYFAALKALESSGLTINDIDLIIVATSSPEKISPSTSCTIHSKFKIEKDIPAFDINAVCSGFVYAVNFVSPLISFGVYKNVLIIATEAYSKVTNWEDKHCVFFGDGAGAIVLGNSEKGWISCENKANGKDTGMTGFNLPIGGPFIMNGKEVWNQAIGVLPDSIRSILDLSGVTIDEVDMIIPHQPSINILKIIAKDLGIPMSKVKTVMDKYANIAGASVPIALDDAIRNKEIKEGDIIVLTAIGSGWTWGSTVLNWVNKFPETI
jgi:3-oxoacyl-[acyl-carrier-protein] synthase III